MIPSFSLPRYRSVIGDGSAQIGLYCFDRLVAVNLYQLLLLAIVVYQRAGLLPIYLEPLPNCLWLVIIALI
jgi:hypothetical protein